jgi:TRAP-type C4-dicarboxylate transport system substrate-binding protein
MFKTRALIGLAAILTAAGVVSATAQEKITLKLGHGYPESHFLWQEGGKVFVDAVTSATNGRVQFEVYPANQLGKDQFGMITSGVAQAGIITPAYASGKLALSAVSELPGLYNSSCEATGKFWELAKEGGLISKSEYENQGLHVLYVSTVPPYSLMTVSKATPTLEDLAGLKIRAAGGAMNKTVESLGATPVQISGAEMYDALSRGTIDGTIYSRMALAGYKLEPLMKHSVDGVRLGSGSIVMTISDKAWKALPDDVKKVMTDSALAAQKNLCAYMDQREAEVSKALVEKNGWSIVKLSPEQVSLWQERIGEVNKSWAAELDASGRPGTAVLEAFKAAKGH